MLQRQQYQHQHRHQYHEQQQQQHVQSSLRWQAYVRFCKKRLWSIAPVYYSAVALAYLFHAMGHCSDENIVRHLLMVSNFWPRGSCAPQAYLLPTLLQLNLATPLILMMGNAAPYLCIGGCLSARAVALLASQASFAAVIEGNTNIRGGAYLVGHCAAQTSEQTRLPQQLTTWQRSALDCFVFLLAVMQIFFAGQARPWRG